MKPEHNNMQLRNLVIYSFIIFCGSFAGSSCSNTKNLPRGDSLYIGARVTIHDNEGTRRYRKTLRRDLVTAVRPKPNTKTLGVRLKLSIYNLAGDTSKGGFLRNILRRFGEPPVLASTLDLEKNEKALTNLMKNRGFFFPTISSEAKTHKRKTKAFFDVNTGPQYKIRNVEFPIDSSQISIDMSDTKGKSLLKPGFPYNLDLIKGERIRIDKVLTEKGYYYFSPEYIIIKADTSVGTNEVDMYVTLKHDEAPEEAYRVYSINDVFVYPHYQLRGQRADTNLANAEFYKGYYVVDRRKTYRPIVFEQAMQFKPGDLYNRTIQNMSLNRLVSIGTWKFVKNRFEPFESDSGSKMNVYYYLTPYPDKTIHAEVGVQSQADSRMGTQTTLSWRHKNAFRGAEGFSITLRGGYEAQAGGNVQRPPVFEGGAEVAFSIPRFLIPFFKVVPSTMFIPRTTIKASYDLSLRQNLYFIHSFKGSYGYIWKEDLRKEHRLFPININYVRTDTLDTKLEQGINFSNIIFNGLIIGPTYEYTFNSQGAGTTRKHNYYFHGLVDFSNNLLGLALKSSKDDQKEIFGTPFAQYMKFMADGRYYLNYSANKNDMWANRIIVGIGIPHGNSRQLPNIKQFFAGGASDLRGFRSRLVGPGTFDAQTASEINPGALKFVETLGDIKLELNTELRTNIYQFLNSAIFIDAGNIWTKNDDPAYPGGKFTGNFIKELAVDAGVGLRLDFQVILIRLDVAFPLRKPWETGNNLSLNNIDISNASWRTKNLIFNLAIGYPF
jgi:outer membrane protein insertion porin family